MKKLCYFINSDWYFDLHWTDRAIAARDAGYEIHIISHFVDDKIAEKFRTLGFVCHNIPLVAQSFNVLIFFRAFSKARKIIQNINPDLLHCITIKPCLIGGFLAKSTHRPVILSFVGLGRVFSAESACLKLLRSFTVMAYKYIASNKCSLFMFEHDKDRAKLADLVGIDYKQTIVIDGAGINPEIYKYSLEQQRDVPVVLFASRMLWSKGLGDLIEAKKILSNKNIHFTLNVAGILVENDKDAIPLATIQKWQSEGVINWLGHCSNVFDLIEESYKKFFENLDETKKERDLKERTEWESRVVNLIENLSLNIELKDVDDETYQQTLQAQYPQALEAINANLNGNDKDEYLPQFLQQSYVYQPVMFDGQIYIVPDVDKLSHFLVDLDG